MLLSLLSQETCLCIQIDQVVQISVLSVCRSLQLLVLFFTFFLFCLLLKAEIHRTKVELSESCKHRQCLRSWRWCKRSLATQRDFDFMTQSEPKLSLCPPLVLPRRDTYGNTDEWRSYIKLQYKDFRLILQYISWFLRLVAGCIFFSFCTLQSHSRSKRLSSSAAPLAAWWPNTWTLT